MTDGAGFPGLAEACSRRSRLRAYVVARYLPATVPASRWARLQAGRTELRGRSAPNAVVFHAVPSVLGSYGARAQAFAAAWSRWVCQATALYTGSPDGAGVLAAASGEDPFAATTALRVAWR